MFDRYAGDSEKKVFKNEEERLRIKTLLWNNLEAEIGSGRVNRLFPVYCKAAILIGIFMSAGILIFVQNRNQEETAWMTVNNTSDSMRKVWLPDSSSVLLASGASISWPSQFSVDGRSVILQSGEGFFDIRKQNGIPFTVRSQNIGVRVLGTSFLVRKNEKRRQVSVSVLTGKVEVYRKKQTVKFLYPNDQLTVYEDKQAYAYKRMPESDIIMWQQGKIVFREQTIGEIAESLSAHCQINIYLNDAAKLDKTKYTLILSSKASIDAAVNMLRNIAPALSYTRSAGSDWIWRLSDR